MASYLHGKRLLVGSRHYLEHDEGVDLAPLAKAIAKQSALGRSLLYLAEDGKTAGMLAIEDPLRPEATEVVASLREMGFNRVLMLTGDDERTAKAIADKVRDHRVQGPDSAHQQGGHSAGTNGSGLQGTDGGRRHQRRPTQIGRASCRERV